LTETSCLTSVHESVWRKTGRFIIVAYISTGYKAGLAPESKPSPSPMVSPFYGTSRSTELDAYIAFCQAFVLSWSRVNTSTISDWTLLACFVHRENSWNLRSLFGPCRVILPTYVTSRSTELDAYIAFCQAFVLSWSRINTSTISDWTLPVRPPLMSFWRKF
jgi:hypothetical protein